MRMTNVMILLPRLESSIWWALPQSITFLLCFRRFLIILDKSSFSPSSLDVEDIEHLRFETLKFWTLKHHFIAPKNCLELYSWNPHWSQYTWLDNYGNMPNTHPSYGHAHPFQHIYIHHPICAHTHIAPNSGFTDSSNMCVHPQDHAHILEVCAHINAATNKFMRWVHHNHRHNIYCRNSCRIFNNLHLGEHFNQTQVYSVTSINHIVIAMPLSQRASTIRDLDQVETMLKLNSRYHIG